MRAVIRAARDLGVTTPIADEASIALGTSSMSLIELTSAYAAIAAGSYPVRARGLAAADEPGWFDRLRGTTSVMDEDELDGIRSLLAASVANGTGRSAALSVRAFGKTGTTQDNRDALFVGYANGLVAAVWVGNDDNTPNAGLSGGGIPARIWRDFMSTALGVSAPVVDVPEPTDEVGTLIDDVIEDANIISVDGMAGIEGAFDELGVDLRMGRDGIEFRPRDVPQRNAPPLDDRRRAPEEAEPEPEPR